MSGSLDKGSKKKIVSLPGVLAFIEVLTETDDWLRLVSKGRGRGGGRLNQSKKFLI